MSQSSQTAKDLIHETFGPRVAVLCSPAATSLCSKNGLSFSQLLQPFCSIKSSVSWQEPGGSQILKTVKLKPVDLASWKPPSVKSLKNPKILHRVVATNTPPLHPWTLHIPSTSTLTPPGGEPSNSNSSNPHLPLPPPPPSEDQFKIHQVRGQGPRQSTSYEVISPLSSPWFQIWRSTFLRLHSQESASTSSTEFLGHFIACFLVISSSEARTSEELGLILSKLAKLQLQHQSEWPGSWFLPSVLKYYLILHENSGDGLPGAELLYQNLRTTYGANFCFMLKINSGIGSPSHTPLNSDPWLTFVTQEEVCNSDLATQSYPPESDSRSDSPVSPLTLTFNSHNLIEMLHPLSPESERVGPQLGEGGPPNGLNSFGDPPGGSSYFDGKKSNSPHGQWLTPDDLSNIQLAVNEFVVKALLPYVERQARSLHETVVNKRSMSKSFFGATKRLFGANAKTAGAVIYALESPEMITRKLADLYFLFGHYAGAYSLYHSLKKDFQGDGAWTYYGSSLEMGAIAHFMMTQSSDLPLAGARSFPVHYVNEAIRVFLENCRMADSALRVALIACECLKALDNYGEAAAVFLRMTAEDCDLRSGLMLEQAASSFLHLTSPRKYAFHSVIAGHRLGKAGLKSHSLNCLLQAGQVYSGRGWRYAEDHVHYSIARHQNSLGLNRDLATFLKSLLRTPTPQPPSQIGLFYKDFLVIMSKLFEEEKCPHELFIPKVQSSGIRTRIGVGGLETGEFPQPPTTEDVPTSYWEGLEEEVVRRVIDPTVIRFKSSKSGFGPGTDNTIHPTVPCNETFYIEIPLENPTEIDLYIHNIGLRWEPGTWISSPLLPQLLLLPGETKVIRFSASSSKRGKLTFDRLFFELSLGPGSSLRVPFTQGITLKGPRLNSTKGERTGIVYGKDLRNEIIITEQMPLLEGQLQGCPSSMFQAQSVPLTLTLRDVSPDPEDLKRVCRIVLAAEGMENCLQVNSLPFAFEPPTPTQNYTSLSLKSTLESNLSIPLTYTAPQSGDIGHLNILVLYEVNRREEVTPEGSKGSGGGGKGHHHHPAHRVIRSSLSVPLSPCLRLTTSKLKVVEEDGSSLTLLRAQNLSPNVDLFLNTMELTPPRLVVTELLSSVGGVSRDQIQVGRLETRNIILKLCSNPTHHLSSSSPMTLLVNWNFSFSKSPGSAGESLSSSGLYRLPFHHEEEEEKVDVKPGEVKDDATTMYLFRLDHQPILTHDFTSTPLLLAQITLKLTAKHTEGTLGVGLGHPTDEETEILGQNGTRAPSAGVLLLGKTQWSLNLSSSSSTTNNSHDLIYQIGITRPGVFNVAPTITLKHEPSVSSVSDPNRTGEESLSFSLHSPLIVRHVRSGS